MTRKYFDSIKILRCGKIKVAKEIFYGAKKPIKICDVNFDTIVIKRR